MELLREGAIAAGRQLTHIRSVGRGVVKMTTMKRQGPHVPCHSLRWVNCQPPVKRWKGAAGGSRHNVHSQSIDGSRKATLLFQGRH